LISKIKTIDILKTLRYYGFMIVHNYSVAKICNSLYQHTLFPLEITFLKAAI